MDSNRNLQLWLVEGARVRFALYPGRDEASCCIHVYIQQSDIIERQKEQPQEKHLRTGKRAIV